MVTATDVLAALRTASLRRVEVAGLELHVRGFSGTERKLLIQRAKDGNPLQANEVVALCACTEKGDPLFTIEQAEALDGLDAGCLEQIAEQVLEASGLTAKARDQAAKN